MNTLNYTKRSNIPVPVEDLFAYHERPGAFQRLNPPWEPVEIIHHSGGIQDGAVVELKMKVGVLNQRMRIRHEGYIKNRQFQDRQLQGIFAHFFHTHSMQPNGATASVLEDKIEYRLPLGLVGKVFGAAFAHRKLERMFTYRHEITYQDTLMHQRYKTQPRLTIAVSGASGVIGSQLVPLLTTGGHTVKCMVRHKSNRSDTIYWDPDHGELNPADLAGVDAVVHLAGENIGGKRWTPAQKRRILNSRIQGTHLLCQTLAKMEQKPKVIVIASAIGYYGDGGENILTEDSPSGQNFQAEVVRAWEAAAAPALEAGIRVVQLRFGVILHMGGGALRKMLLPFQWGLGGVLGNGKQYFSWIALDDALGLIHEAIMNDDMRGVYNATTPHNVTNREYTKTLGHVLGRPTLLPVPAFALRLLFGELANELLLASLRVQPKRLQDMGYEFRYPTLETALRHILGKQPMHSTND